MWIVAVSIVWSSIAEAVRTSNSNYSSFKFTSSVGFAVTKQISYTTTLRTTRVTHTSSSSTASKTTISKPTYVNRFVNISWVEFGDAFLKNRFPVPNRTHYTDFINGVELYGNITSKREAAMFLAQLLHESGGLKYKAELRCVENPKNCINDYKTPRLDVKGKQYYGRGYIQLTWAENYLAASKDLFGDDRLLKDPDSVASNGQLSWDVSFWYWKARVGMHAGIHRGEFGVSTMMINGGIECSGKPNAAAMNRFQLYSNVLAAFGIDEKPNPLGCKRILGPSKYGKIIRGRRF